MKLFFLLAVLCFSRVFSARILAVFPLFLKSHSIFTHSIVRELGVRGHNVTILTPFEDPDPPPNYRQVIADQRSCWEDVPDEAEKEMFLNGKIPYVFMHIERWKSTLWFTEAAFNSTPIQDFIKNDNSQFDLVITELFNQEAFLMFGHKYNAPIAMLSSFGSGHSISEQMGTPLAVSAVPFEYSGYFGYMSIWQRMVNAIYTFGDLFGRKFYYLPSQQELVEQHFADLPKPLPKLADLERNVSLVLLNTHFSVDSIRPSVPGIIEVGGVHIKPPKKLPADLQKFMDEASHGVIFFSLGTIMKSSELGAKKLKTLVKVFGGLKQRVLWKWEGDDMPSGVASNIRFEKWLPQSGILAHKNTVLFMTHGGLLGGQEAIHYGVPILGIPFYGDQFLNVARAVKIGYGLQLLYKDITEMTLSDKLGKLLTDPSFKNTARDVAKRFNDKPNTSMETAMFWIEYVIRHKGAPYMRSPILDVWWFEYYLIDGTALLIFGVLAVGIAVYSIIAVLCKLLFYRKQYKKKPKNKDE